MVVQGLFNIKYEHGKSIGSSGAYDISSTENLCMASEGESYGGGLSKKLVEKRISAQMKKANSEKFIDCLKKK